MFPKGFELRLICCNLLSIWENNMLLTSEISSIMRTDKCLYLLLRVLAFSAIKGWNFCWTGMSNAWCKVNPSTLNAAAPVGAHRRTRIWSRSSTVLTIKYLCKDWYNALIKTLLPVPAPPLKNVLSGSDFVRIHWLMCKNISRCLKIQFSYQCVIFFIGNTTFQ